MLIENVLEKLEKSTQMRVNEMICKFLHHRIKQDIVQFHALMKYSLMKVLQNLHSNGRGPFK